MLLARDARPPSISHLRSNEALVIIDHYRSEIGELIIEPLDAEFPYEAQWLRSGNVLFADSTENEARTFKARGALVGAVALQEMGVEKVKVPSAGNHARGAILATRILDMSVQVIVPSTAPRAKREGLRALWDSSKLEIIVGGPTFDDCLQQAQADEAVGELLHPYDNKHVIAGQGTIVDDILRAQPDIQHIVVPVGGGGLVSGILDRLAQLGRHDILVHAVEAPGSNSLSRSLERDRIVAAEAPNSNYGGSAVRKIGKRALSICNKQRDNLQVHSDVTEQMVYGVIGDYQQGREDLWRQSTPNFEPTSLVALAALEAILRDYPDDRIVVIGTGRNASLDPVRSRGYSTAVWK